LLRSVGLDKAVRAEVATCGSAPGATAFADVRIVH
jgi:hypothetical protein